VQQGDGMDLISMNPGADQRRGSRLTPGRDPDRQVNPLGATADSNSGSKQLSRSGLRISRAHDECARCPGRPRRGCRFETTRTGILALAGRAGGIFVFIGCDAGEQLPEGDVSIFFGA